MASFDSLMEQLDSKRTVLASGIINHQNLALGIYAEAFNDALKQLDREFINGRLWSKDGSIWKSHGPTTEKIEQRLGWLDTERTIDIDRLKALQADVKGKYSHAVVLCMGGTACAGSAGQDVRSAEGYPAYWCWTAHIRTDAD